MAAPRPPTPTLLNALFHLLYAVLLCNNLLFTNLETGINLCWKLNLFCKDAIVLQKLINSSKYTWQLQNVKCQAVHCRLSFWAEQLVQLHWAASLGWRRWQLPSSSTSFPSCHFIMCLLGAEHGEGTFSRGQPASVYPGPHEKKPPPHP